MLDLPQLALASQSSWPRVPLRPATAEASSTYAPNCGVKPPGKIFWKVKQLGSFRTWFNAARSVTTPPFTRTSGQPAESSSTPSRASIMSPTNNSGTCNVSPSGPVTGVPLTSVLSLLVPNTPLRVFGFRK